MTTKSACPLEEDEAKALAQYLRLRGWPFTHIANESNGGTRSAVIRGAKMKAMGVARGVFDYEIFIPVRNWCGEIDAYQEIRVELKRKHGGSVSKEQKEWAEIYTKCGIPNAVCRGADEAIKFIEECQYAIGLSAQND